MNYRIVRLSEVSAQTLYRWERAPEAQALGKALCGEARAPSLCAEHLARTMLSECCKTPPESFIFAREKNGKPYAVGVPFFFNVSHSGDFVLCAVDTQPIGADIEVLRPVRHSLPARVCTAEELSYATPDGVLDHARFLQIWTAKEAVLKQSGRSVLCDLRQISVIRDDSFAFPPLSLHSHTTSHYALCIAYTPSF